MARGGRSRAARNLSEAGERAPLGTSNRGATAPHAAGKPGAAKPAEAAAAPPARPPPRRRSSPPQLPAAAAALPGLDDDTPPTSPNCHLPLEGNAGEAASYGSALADSLRVTSITRKHTARLQSQLRFVVQPDSEEGQRLSLMPPLVRLNQRARTMPLRQQQGPKQASSPQAEAERTGKATADKAGKAAAAEPTGERPVAAAVATSSSEAAPAVQPLPGASAVTPPQPLTEEAGAASSASSGCGAQEQEAAAELAAAAAAGSGDEASSTAQEAAAPDAPATGSSSEQASPPAHPAAAIYSGVSAEDEAAALRPPGPPAWLQQQGACRNEPGVRVEQCPPPVHTQHAVAQWRAMWLAGLQWHNACRAGHPTKAGSPFPFVPLDANEPLLELFMGRTSVMPEHVIAGTARFQDILQGSPELHAAAVECGVFSYGVWGVPAPGGGWQMLAGGRQMAMPISLRAAPPQTVALFLSCVWHEANRAETAQHATHTFGAKGERVSEDDLNLKYPLSELREWVRLAVGCGKRLADDCLASLEHLACFGAE